MRFQSVRCLQENIPKDYESCLNPDRFGLYMYQYVILDHKRKRVIGCWRCSEGVVFLHDPDWTAELLNDVEENG